VNLIELAH